MKFAFLNQTKPTTRAAMKPISSNAIGIKRRIFASNLKGFFMSIPYAIRDSRFRVSRCSTLDAALFGGMRWAIQ
jgi:hypothetical protein